MQHRDHFSGFHPINNFIYFTLVLIFTMFLMHPVMLGVSLVSSFAYLLHLNGSKAVRFTIKFMLPMMLMAAMINPAFNHEGITVLAYLPSGNPLTLESILYGIGAACMLAAVLCWFACYSAVISSDKFIYLFGRVIPGLSLILSMTMRFVPKFKEQFRIVKEAQCCAGRDAANGSMFHRIKNAVLVLSIMVTWSLENAIETADSMKSRGYGLPGRTAFSIYRFDSRDIKMLIWLLFCGICIIAGWAAGGLAWTYFPTTHGALVGLLPTGLQLIYFALCMTPLFVDFAEDRKWRACQSSL